MDYDRKEWQKQPHPREKANIFSIIFYLWTLDLFSIGYKRKLEIKDIYDTLKDHSSSTLGRSLEKAWNAEIGKARTSFRKPKLARALFKIFGPQYLLCGVVMAVVDFAFCYGLPICLGKLISHFSIDKNEKLTNQDKALLFAGGLIFFLLLTGFTKNWYMERVKHIGIQIQVALSSLLFKKVLLLGNRAVSQMNVGNMMNILSNDSSQFDKSFLFLNHIWMSPLGAIVISYFLWQEIGFSAIIGVAVILFFIPLHGFLGKKSSQFRRRCAFLTDRRIKLMHEIICGIRIIKMYAWEKPFVFLVAQYRKKEMQKIRSVLLIRQGLASFLVFHARLAFFCGIFSFVMAGNEISAKKIFITAALFNILRDSMTSYFPLGVLLFADLLVSLERLQSFLILEEFDQTRITGTLIMEKQTASVNGENNENSDSTNTEIEPLNSKQVIRDISNYSSLKYEEYAIHTENLSAKWSESSKICLNNISIDIPKNNLSVVIGPVGAGKSSLLQAFLKELAPINGSIEISGDLSYLPQEAWLFLSSVEQNILFGRPMNKERYDKVIDVCALNVDFRLLPFGDRTVIGERGTTLSIGQKARITLARAIYQEADIYLLDDPLSSVDASVGKHLYDECIKGFLKNKTCVLVTHQLQYLTDVDNIFVLAQGSIVAKGSYNELYKSGMNFTNLLKSAENQEYNTSYINSSDVPSKMDTCNENSNVHSTKTVHTNSDDDRNIKEQIVGGTALLDTYRAYFMNGGKLYFMLLVIFLCILTQFIASSIDVWIAYWINLKSRTHLSDNLTLAYESDVIHKTSFITPEWGVYIFTILTMVLIVVTLVRTYMFVKLSIRSSLKLHDAMFQRIIRATLSFFSFNPTGRILNRFSKDIEIVDEILPLIFINFIQAFLPLVGIIIVVAGVNPFILLPTFIIMLILYKLYNYYVATSTDIKRIESVARSQVYSYYNVSFQGRTSIRVFKAQDIVQKEFNRLVDVNSSASYLFVATSRAFSLYCDLFCILFIAILSFSFIFLQKGTSEGNFGLAVTQALSFMGMLQWCLRQNAELENQITAVERIKEYCEVPCEVNLKSNDDIQLDSSWPNKGELRFENVYLRYEREGPYRLKNINFTVEAGEKVGVVGRTGAGKSSLIEAIFCLTDTEGKIMIDGVDIRSVELQNLRSKISVIPQEPILFSGTLRRNLDPFNEHSDHVLWKSLEEVQLTEVFSNLSNGLDSEVSVSGSNFSVGERQLICLARAIIRKNKILILDEATANVDPQTDILIQNVIREKFKNNTVLTIAHRLNSVMDSDRILVIRAGTVVEFDRPLNLLKNKDSLFRQMALKTGPVIFQTLCDAAYQKYLQVSIDELPFIDS